MAADSMKRSEERSVNDYCRMCKENLRIKGNICNSQRIFQGVPHGKRIDQRLAELDLNLVNIPEKSFRICQKCIRLVGRHETTLATIRGWQKAEEEPSADQTARTSSTDTSAASVQTATLKRDRVRTPSKLRTQPSTPTGPPSSKLPRPASEGIDRPRQSVTDECHVNANCQVSPIIRHVASQTDPPDFDFPKTRSVGTQLSMKTLQNPFRSTGTQVKVTSRDRGMCTVTLPLNSPMLFLQPTLVKRPSKRPRLNLTEDEEEGPSE